MSLDYTRYYEDGWKNKPNRSTPVVAEALNAIDDAIIETQEAIKGIGGKNVASAKMATGQITDAFDGSAIVTDFEKNLIPYPYFQSNKEEHGVTFTVNDDGSISVKGTATDSVVFIIWKYKKINKPFVLSGCPKNGGVGKYILYVAGTDFIDSGEGYLISDDSSFGEGKNFVIRIYNGQTVDLVFHPMIVEVAEDGSYQEEYIPTTGYDVTFESNELTSKTVHVNSKSEIPVLGLNTYEGVTNVISPFEISFDYPTSKEGAYILDGYSIAKQNERKLSDIDALMTTMMLEEDV